MIKHRFLLFLLITLAIIGCKKESPISENADFGYSYFPLDIGDSSFFQVEKITWNDFDNTIDTVSYLLCEYIESMTTNYAGDSLYRIERMKRISNSEPWNFDSTWYAIRNKHQALRVENNISFVKLIFPVFENQTWNKNIYNQQGEKTAKMVSISPVRMSNIDYANALTIELENFVSIINSDVETEVYAPALGLINSTKLHVYKEYNALTGQFEITSGYSYIQNKIH